MEYRYTARTKEGKHINRLMVAENPSHVISHLKTEGLMPIRVRKVKPSNGKAKRRVLSIGNHVKTKELAVITRQLGVTLTSGLLLTEALEAVSEDLENAYFRRTLHKIKFDVQCGTELSAALGKYPKREACHYCGYQDSNDLVVI